LRHVIGKLDRIRVAGHLHGVGVCSKPCNSQADGNFSSRYDEVGCGDDYRHGGSSGHCCDTGPTHCEREARRESAVYGNGGE
jgi:hypothetical protein